MQRAKPSATTDWSSLLRDNRSRPAAELSLLLLNEIRAWQPAATPQQDDITLLVIDVL